MKYRIGLVDNRSAWILDLPGVVVGGESRLEIEALLPVVIAEHLTWLRGHGEAVDDAEGWEVVESHDSDANASAGSEFCFVAERDPLPAHDLDRLIARMEFARTDLLSEVAALPDVLLDWTPPKAAMKHVDDWAPDVRSIRQVVEHVLQLEVYYMDGLRDGPAKGIFEAVSDPSAERSRTIQKLRSLSDEERSRSYRPVRPGRSVSDEWTVRKVIRRIISHERAHAAEIRQRLTWLLLGVPRIRPEA